MSNFDQIVFLHAIPEMNAGFQPFLYILLYILPVGMIKIKQRRDDRQVTSLFCKAPLKAWVKVFRIIPEFRILRLTFHRKSASKC